MSIKLENLRSGEMVEKVIRRHWIVFVVMGMYAFWGLIFTLILPFVLGMGAIGFLAITIFWLFYSLFLYINWVNYELDIFVITNNRIICVEQHSFLNRTVGETTLDKVQEVDVQTKWLLANLLDYGTLRIMTAGSSQSFDMTYSPTPLKNSRYINNIVDRYRDNLYGGQSGKEKVSAWSARMSGV